jgi:ABC-type multidrug transport system fused ATPase/permease subunit
MIGFRMTGLRISARIRYLYLTALFSLPVSVLDTIPTGQTANTITATANLLQLGISDKLGTLIQFSTLMLTAVIIVSDQDTVPKRAQLTSSGIHFFLGFDSRMLLCPPLYWTSLWNYGSHYNEDD